MPGLMGIDIETYSSAPLPKCGVYRYCDAPDFEILLFSYAFDDEPVQTIDLASGETLPKEAVSALADPFPPGTASPEWTRCSSIIWAARIRCISEPSPER